MAEAFDHYQVDGLRIQPGDEGVEAGVACLVGFRDQRPAAGGGDQHLACARLAQLVAVLARDVDVEIVVRVLDEAGAQSLLREQQDQFPEQGGLAGPAVGGEVSTGRAGFMRGARRETAGGPDSRVGGCSR